MGENVFLVKIRHGKEGMRRRRKTTTTKTKDLTGLSEARGDDEAKFRFPVINTCIIPCSCSFSLPLLTGDSFFFLLVA